MKTKKILLVCAAALLVMACNLTTPGGGDNPDQITGGDQNSAPNPVPVSINDGLASLNTYEMSVVFSTVGPDPATSSTTTFQRVRSNDQNASTTTINMNITSPDESEPAVSDTTIYQIGNDQCSGNDSDGWSWTSSTPAEAEIQGLMYSMIGLTPLIENPTFVAAETLIGIPTNHFTFQVSGLGSSSGAVVNINQGDYWLAIDGQYIVKYVLTVETSMAAEGEVYHEEISIVMTQINQPVSIAFPQGCLDASLETENP
jgi:hypothetical protein